jgi:AbrB family looped-hinge helix DNA binding protein
MEAGARATPAFSCLTARHARCGPAPGIGGGQDRLLSVPLWNDLSGEQDPHSGACGGHIVIPAAIRAATGLRDGDDVQVEVAESGEIRLIPLA